jgi:predicted adenine nucleotide alpha hydrolase (AANH) superfamily ATPase
MGLNMKPKLLLHACCAPCLSYSLEHLSPDYNITVYFYNPNIMPLPEYEKRLADVRRMVRISDSKLMVGEYDNETFLSMAKGLETFREGGDRCKRCIRHRLAKTAEFAKKHYFDLFSTTLTISPHKNAKFINDTQAEFEAKYGVKSLPLDLKKKGGFLRSIELSRALNLYRQNYCGCRFDIPDEADIEES